MTIGEKPTTTFEKRRFIIRNIEKNASRLPFIFSHVHFSVPNSLPQYKTCPESRRRFVVVIVRNSLRLLAVFILLLFLNIFQRHAERAKSVITRDRYRFNIFVFIYAT